MTILSERLLFDGDSLGKIYQPDRNHKVTIVKYYLNIDLNFGRIIHR